MPVNTRSRLQNPRPKPRPKSKMTDLPNGLLHKILDFHTMATIGRARGFNRKRLIAFLELSGSSEVCKAWCEAAFEVFEEGYNVRLEKKDDAESKELFRQRWRANTRRRVLRNTGRIKWITSMKDHRTIGLVPSHDAGTCLGPVLDSWKRVALDDGVKDHGRSGL